MCLVFLSYNQNKEYPLIVLANRDEFFDRPTMKAGFWDDRPTLLAGKDLQAGGTWLGVTTDGYMAMLTNYRDVNNVKANAPSRGKLVADFLTGKFQPKQYLTALDAAADHYNGYNIILGTVRDPWYYSNNQRKIYRLGSGLYGLSNAYLDTPWHKVKKGKESIKTIIKAKSLDVEQLFSIMQNHELANNDDLPQTGLALEFEKAISPIFIKTSDYGTRCTTLITVDKNNELRFLERTFDSHSVEVSEVKFELQLKNS